ncbi:SDR family oxidoreductase [Flagellimonas sp. S174]|uniref:SDR family oxidoreductase n=1 Tax=Flagellimonas sp. S174 TaxID=3410790 RepID=UPI003BF53ED3
MHISLLGKNALVGGSSKGIGKAIALQMASSGANVTVMARNEEALKKVVDEMDISSGQNHKYLVVDFSDFEGFSQKMSKFFENQTIDILVNNTQGPEAGGALEKTVSDYQKAFDLLFKSVVLTTEHTLKGMLQKKWGRIINVASISVKEPLNYLALSNSIRAAMVTWAKSLAIDVGKDNITVNSVLTGYFDTDRIAALNAKKAEKMGVSPDKVRSAMEEQVPAKRIGRPEEYGFLVTFLASEQAGYISGTNIPIDGGLLKSM